MSQRSSRHPVPTANPFRVLPARIKDMNEQELGELMSMLLRAQAQRSGSPLDQIRVNTEEKAGDEGCDAWTAAPAIPDPWLGATETCWQLKAGTAGQPRNLAGEVTKPIPTETLSNGGRFVVVASQSVSGRGGDTKRKNALVQEAGEQYASQIDVLGSERLAEWCTQHPAIAAHLNGLPSSVWRLADWEASDEHQLPWWLTEETESDVQGHRAALTAATNPLLHLHVYGPPGVGKSRYALELCRGATFREEVLYVRQADDVPVPALISHLAELAIQPVVIVVDEVASGQLRRLRDEVGRHSDQVRLITIGYQPSPDPARIPHHTVRRQPSEVMARIVRSWHPDFPRERIEFVVRFADGYVRLAKLAGEAVAQQPHLGAGNLLAIETIRQHLKGLLGQHRHGALHVVALLNRVGWSDDLEVEGQSIANHLGLDWRQVQSDVQAIDQELHIVPRGGRFRMISPRPLALYLAAEAWETFPNLIGRLPGVLPTNSARLAFWARQRQMASFRPTAQYATRALEEPFGVQDLSSEIAIRQWGTLAASDPERGLAKMRNTLERATLAECERISFSARQALIGELRRLVWPIATFHEAALCLALLAESDDDRPSLNATDVFVRLFGIWLSGTAVPFDERLEAIDWLVTSGKVAFLRLAVRALTQAVKRDHFRLPVAEPTDATREPEWRPANDQEKLACVLIALQRLREIAAAAPGDLQADLLEATRYAAMWLRNSATRAIVADLFLTLRRALPSAQEALRGQVAELLDRETRHWQELEPMDLAPIESLHAELEDPSLLGRIRQWVRSSHWDVARQPDLDPLARELLETPDGLLQVLPWLTSGEATGAWRLGECIAALDPQGNLEPLLVSDANHGGDWRLLCGYLNAKHVAFGDVWYDNWLRRYAHASPIALGMWFDVAWRCGVTETGAVLIEHLLRTQSVSDRTVSRLALGQWSLDLPAPSLRGVLQAMVDRDHRATALQILSHRVEQKGEEAEFWGEIARDLILDLVPLRANDHLEYPWKALALPYVGTQAAALTRAILDSHLNRRGAVWFLEFSEAKIVLIECAKREPAVVWAELESRLSGPEAERIVAYFPGGVLEHLPIDAIVRWVSENPELRASFLADLIPMTYTSDQTIEARLVGLYGDKRAVKRAFLNALTRSRVGLASEYKDDIADRLDAVASRTSLPKLRRWAQWASHRLRIDAAQDTEVEQERWFGLHAESD